MTATAFNSPLAKDMHAYLELRRALGAKALVMEVSLRQLDAFIVREHPQIVDLSPTILAAWFAERTSLAPATRSGQMSTIRRFCLFRRRTDPNVYVPERQKDRVLWPVRVPRYRPYIFTEDEVKKVLQAALDVPSRSTVPPRAQTFFTILLLLYTTGLRLSEAVGLHVGDIDWVEGTLLIRDTKFFKTRLVPVAPDVLAKLRCYQSLLRLPRGRASLTLPFFQKEPGHGYCSKTIGHAGIKILRAAGIKSATGRGGPRLHDLRNTFAVKCIARWYTQGRDVQNLLPRLATYMGHKNLLSTQYYLNITVDILHVAGERFERACAPTGRA